MPLRDKKFSQCRTVVKSLLLGMWAIMIEYIVNFEIRNPNLVSEFVYKHL